MPYHDSALEKRQNSHIKTLATKANRKLKRLGIDKNNCVLIGTGLSGVMAASKLSVFMNIDCAFMRKETDTNHHDSRLSKKCENTITQDRYLIFCDDFIDSGLTLERIVKRYSNVKAFILLWENENMNYPSNLGFKLTNLVGRKS